MAMPRSLAWTRLTRRPAMAMSPLVASSSPAVNEAAHEERQHHRPRNATPRAGVR